MTVENTLTKGPVSKVALLAICFSPVRPQLHVAVVCKNRPSGRIQQLVGIEAMCTWILDAAFLANQTLFDLLDVFV